MPYVVMSFNPNGLACDSGFTGTRFHENQARSFFVILQTKRRIEKSEEDVILLAALW